MGMHSLILYSSSTPQDTLTLCNTARLALTVASMDQQSSSNSHGGLASQSGLALALKKLSAELGSLSTLSEAPRGLLDMISCIDDSVTMKTGCSNLFQPGSEDTYNTGVLTALQSKMRDTMASISHVQMLSCPAGASQIEEDSAVLYQPQPLNARHQDPSRLLRQGSEDTVVPDIPTPRA